MNKIKGFIVVLLLVVHYAHAQEEIQTNNFISNLVEDFIESSGDENFDYNTILDNLQHYYEYRLNINSASENDLKELFILNEIQIKDFIQYREKFGSFLSIYEVQAIPSWDLTTIKNVSPFLKCEIADADYNLNFKDAFTKGKSTLFLKTKRVLEQKKGYISNDQGETAYLGTPNHFYARYRYEYGQDFKAGITAENDAGEPLFNQYNKKGFDYYSFFVMARKVNRFVSMVTLGDYVVSMGQGLILHNDFGIGKSSFVMNVKRAGRSLRPYSSVNEVNYYRGVGITLTPVNHVETTIFASYKPVDASLRTDTLDNTDFDYFGSVRQDGYHRTLSEIENKNTLYQGNGGIKVKYKNRKLELGLNTLYTYFSLPLIKDEQLYKKYLFAGKQLINASVEYGYRWKNLNLFGETAISDNGGKATTNGALISVDRNMDISLLYRNFSPDFHTLNGNAFSESSLPINESGLYWGIEIRPIRKWTISSYVDFWKHPWIGYRRDGITDGKEFFIKVQYVEKRKLECYLQYRYEKKYLNSSGTEKIDYPQAQVLQRIRAHFSYKITKEWEIRDRIELSNYFKTSVGKGYMMYQDVMYKPIAKPFSFTARFAMFDINSFDARIYTYENDLLYEFYIPFYQNKGTRFYINGRYRIGRNITFEMRYARTYYDDINSIGNGNEQILGSVRSEAKAQLKLKF